jgi:hypothetical protein
MSRNVPFRAFPKRDPFDRISFGGSFCSGAMLNRINAISN